MKFIVNLFFNRNILPDQYCGVENISLFSRTLKYFNKSAFEYLYSSGIGNLKFSRSRAEFRNQCIADKKVYALRSYKINAFSKEI